MRLTVIREIKNGLVLSHRGSDGSSLLILALKSKPNQRSNNVRDV